jgi:hypothetical protein
MTNNIAEPRSLALRKGCRYSLAPPPEKVPPREFAHTQMRNGDEDRLATSRRKQEAGQILGVGPFFRAGILFLSSALGYTQ